MTRRRDLTPLADALGEFVGDVQPTTTLARVQSAWPGAVGETIAGWAEPVSEQAGVVTVRCNDSMVAHELEMMKDQLLEKLSAALPEGAPRELKFRSR